jgi:membrane-bound ClpP family serine protease
VFDRSETHRVWLGIAGLLLVVIGVLLIRHLDLTVALVGLVIGITWIVQGLAELVDAFSGGPGERRGWWIFFGLISLVAGIVVVAVPTTSVTVLAAPASPRRSSNSARPHATGGSSPSNPTCPNGAWPSSPTWTTATTKLWSR